MHPTSSALAISDPRAIVLAELAAQPMLLAGKFCYPGLDETASVIATPVDDGVELFAASPATALRVRAEGVIERRIEIPAKALQVVSRRFSDAELCSVVQGPDRALGLRFYSEKESLAVVAIEGCHGPDPEQIETVMGCLDSEREDRVTAHISRGILVDALQGLKPIAAISFSQRSRGIAIRFNGDGFSGELVLLGLNRP